MVFLCLRRKRRQGLSLSAFLHSVREFARAHTRPSRVPRDRSAVPRQSARVFGVRGGGRAHRDGGGVGDGAFVRTRFRGEAVVVPRRPARVLRLHLSARQRRLGNAHRDGDGGGMAPARSAPHAYSRPRARRGKRTAMGIGRRRFLPACGGAFLRGIFVRAYPFAERRLQPYFCQLFGRAEKGIAVDEDKIRAFPRDDRALIRFSVLQGGVFGDGEDGFPHGDLLSREFSPRGGRAQDGAGDRLPQIGRGNGGILVQGEGDAQRRRVLCGGEIAGASFAQVFQVRIPPMIDVRYEEGGDRAQLCKAGELIFPEDLRMDEDGTEAPSFVGRKAGERAEEPFRGAVPVAVREKLRAPIERKAAGGENFRLGHGRRAVAPVRIRFAQKRRLALRRAVEEDLHSAQAEAAVISAHAVGKGGGIGVVILGRGVSRHIQAKPVGNEFAVEGEHLRGEQAFLRGTRPAGEIDFLRAEKGFADTGQIGQRHAAGAGDELRLLKKTVPVGRVAEGAERRRIERARVSRGVLQEDGTVGKRPVERVPRRKFSVRKAFGAHVARREEIGRGKPVLFFKTAEQGEQLFLRTAIGRVRLQEGDREGKQMGMRIEKGGQDERAVQVPPFATVRGRDESAPLHGKGRAPRKGAITVFVCDLHNRLRKRRRQAAPFGKVSPARAFFIPALDNLAVRAYNREQEGGEMLVSTKGRYALKFAIALRDRGGRTPLREAAEATGIPVKYLEQIVPSLLRAGLIVGSRGAGGGYELSRAAGEITAGEILRAAEGALAPVACLGGKECEKRESCPTRAFFEGMDRAVNEYADSVPLSAFPSIGK